MFCGEFGSPDACACADVEDVANKVGRESIFEELAVQDQAEDFMLEIEACAVALAVRGEGVGVVGCWMALFHCFVVLEAGCGSVEVVRFGAFRRNCLMAMNNIQVGKGQRGL